MSEKIFYETLETWKGGKSNGYYEPFKNEIHILRGQDLQFRTLVHEKAHMSRRNKLSFKLASVLQIPSVSWLMFTFMLILSIYAFSGDYLPLLSVAGVFSFLLCCTVYEEARADQVMLRSCKQIKSYGEKTE